MYWAHTITRIVTNQIDKQNTMCRTKSLSINQNKILITEYCWTANRSGWKLYLEFFV